MPSDLLSILQAWQSSFGSRRIFNQSIAEILTPFMLVTASQLFAQCFPSADGPISSVPDGLDHQQATCLDLPVEARGLSGTQRVEAPNAGHVVVAVVGPVN